MVISPVVRRVCVAALLVPLLGVGIGIQGKTKKAAARPEVELKPLKKQDVYVPSVLQWERPHATNPNDWTSAKAHVNIAVFSPSGEFAAGEVSVVRSSDGQLIAQPEEDFSLRRGTWTRDGKSVVVQSQWVKYEKADGKKKKKKKPVKETWFTDPKVDKNLSHYIVIGATEYVQADTLQNPEAVQKMFFKFED